ncbi:hypothetical protein BDK51DRAFT_27750 [Blyttiomyces helicus]|uniref:Uncharacterized protein n=1 Tax=Blyttiomyces helicus TaxID=388810 RepID=A0A4P9WSK3_9FUNG|nr:hypothetical protein BDK51DRAFT_27750 [Blyttiomyces helicus]|eukprot:RKO93996.1 hypothetical protein BDK51DRAFT_27750 [Blyttiomyces helicus]
MPDEQERREDGHSGGTNATERGPTDRKTCGQDRQTCRQQDRHRLRQIMAGRTGREAEGKISSQTEYQPSSQGKRQSQRDKVKGQGARRRRKGDPIGQEGV